VMMCSGCVERNGVVITVMRRKAVGMASLYCDDSIMMVLVSRE